MDFVLVSFIAWTLGAWVGLACWFVANLREEIAVWPQQIAFSANLVVAIFLTPFFIMFLFGWLLAIIR